MALEKVIFLDRDGVINADSPNYIKGWHEYEFLPGSLDALTMLTKAGYTLIVVTNQSMIGRGMVPLHVLQDMHHRMRAAVESAGGHIHDIFYCPHRPDEGCACRKPAPGMILAASRRHGINLPTSMMIGDNVKDVRCGKNAGCGQTVLVRTGSGLEAEKQIMAQHIATHVADDLHHAARMILAGQITLDSSTSHS